MGEELRVDVYIISKDEGSLLHKYSLLGWNDRVRDELTSGFLAAVNRFAREIGFPEGVTLIRSGSLEARFASGEFVFTVLIIDYKIPLGHQTDPILEGLASEINIQFERTYRSEIIAAKKDHMYNTDVFSDFGKKIDAIINRFGKETEELYQKLILIEAIYANIPQDICIRLLEDVSAGNKVFKKIKNLIKIYPELKKIIHKVNTENWPVWEVFAVPILLIDRI